MTQFVAITTVASLIVAWIVTVRMIRLGRRTQGLPERVLAIAFGGTFCIGAPLATASRAPTLVGTSVGALLFIAGAGFCLWGMVSFYRFPRHVFRPESKIARIAVIAAAAAGVVVFLGTSHAVIGVTDRQLLLERLRPWALALLTMGAIPFAWNGIESALYHRRLKRQLGLGLTDAATTNRFLLWSLASLGSAALCLSMLVLRLAGMPVIGPIPLTIMAIGNLVTSSCWYLAFMPPAWARGWLGDGETAPV